ncbi:MULTISPECIES: DNA topoisomerase III [Nitrosomonas]|uniref:DNA topoisomerase n=1 Tax=Nitrosomonas communis TaxID=44574 RepID=A0A0F7KG04_9PROT|nr:MULTISPECIES: DNA topoisomerase III [Nitrosomonas]AKH38371.1 DNA topoisomerase III [Nitrosomonas communis]TYP90115.1 DNA topoisomerase-3 [Nitrosomonas communis]UVS60377.1 DNA topoisomerase III [Nitrosomonas sp. PLL12]
MSKKLIIAEKPSVATDIARALGNFTKETDYFESDEYVLSSAVGHLLELTVPEDYEVKRGKWSFDHLPVIPPYFDLAPIEKTANRLKLLIKLIKRKDVGTLINACDAGREGELIFRYITRYADIKKPVKRLWLQSMTPAAIREAFSKLLDDSEVQPLAEAAVSRSESDWLVGINGTRAMTAFNSQEGGFHKTTVGRVQTPTLAILVEREEAIKKFVPKDYWEIHAIFSNNNDHYKGKWFDEKFSKDKENSEARAERIWEKNKAEAIKIKCQGKPGIVSEESKPAKETCPLLYDLTSLQRDANSRFGFSAKTTLGLAQALYEKHKVLTYPRTDSRALPEDYIAPVKDTLHALVTTEYDQFAKQILDSDWVKPNKRIFNNTKVSDHFAIIPTSLEPKKLNDAETKLYDLVTKRFLAIFYPAAEFLVTTRITRVEGEPFKTEGRIMINAGWQAVYGKSLIHDDKNDGTVLPAISADKSATTEEIKVISNQTRPPARFNESTLLSAMEGAGKLVEDEELRAAMSAKGLGTPATRAAIIEGLVSENYIQRMGRELYPTAKAFSLVTLLRGLKIPELISPELTGDWEFKLRQIEQGKLKREAFMAKIADMTKHIVEQAKNHRGKTISGDFATLKVPCPKCGGVIQETYKKFQCQQCDFALWKILAGRQFEIEEMETLISKGEIGPLQGFRSKMGRLFNAIIKLTDTFEMKFEFGSNDMEEADAIDFSNQHPLGKCPKCSNSVYEHGLYYVCEKAVGATHTCDFKTGKIILSRAIEQEQIVKLLQTRKTDLLTKFISKKGRPFSAYLVIGKEGKIEFEFEQKASKAKIENISEVKTSPSSSKKKRA